jgi:diguanylate cyclase (GGDEF)-like protein
MAHRRGAEKGGVKASLLFDDDVDHERMLEMDRRLRPARRTTMVILAVALTASAPWIGWWTLIPLAAAAVFFRVLEPLVDRATRPEWALFAAWASSQVILAGAIALAGGPVSALFAWMALPIVTLGMRFSGRGVWIGVGFTIVLMLGVAFGVYADQVFENPTRLIAPIALVIALGFLQGVVTKTDQDTRARALVDPLTGLLNRSALLGRVSELEQLAAVGSDPVAVIVGDLDHFKRVNDEFGHSAGDAVLAAAGRLFRDEMRAFDLIYRLGGEEFVILLPGASLDSATRKAEQLRRRVAAHRFGRGISLTISFGVAVSAAGAGFEYDSVFEQADRALYEAKAAGRDTVRPPALSDERTLELIPA